MSGAYRRPRTLLLALALLLSAIAGAIDRSQLVPLPLPDLSTMEDATRRRLEQLQGRVTELDRSATDAELAEAYGTLGTYYIAHHLNDAAEAALINASHLAPGDYRWPYYLGFVDRIVGKADLEREAYERVLELKPRDIPSHLHLAELYLTIGDNEAAYQEFRRTLELSPAEAAAHSGLGRAADALGRHEEAVEHLNKALELQPQATILHYQLALAYRRLGDMEAARAHLELRGDREVGFADPLLAAIEPLTRENVVDAIVDMAGKPEEHDDRSIVGFAATYLVDAPDAVERIQQAIDTLTSAGGSTEPSPAVQEHDNLVAARLHLALANLHLTRGQLEAAQHEATAALELDPKMAGAELLLGYMAERKGNLVDAVAHYTVVLAGDPDNVDALRSRARSNLALHANREAITDLERLCAMGLEENGARIRLAVAYLRLGEFETARGHYERALELNLEPADAAQVHHHLGVIDDRTGSLEDAVEHYRTALALDPTLVVARLDLASALHRLGRDEESEKLYHEVVTAEPRNVRARLGEAEVLQSLGRWREARSSLEAGWRMVPGSVELLQALARLLASAGDPGVRDGARALDLARRMLRAGTSPSSLETLAMASAEAGNFDDAVRLQRQVIQMATWDGRSDDLPRLEANLARYEAGSACCASLTAGQ